MSIEQLKEDVVRNIDDFDKTTFGSLDDVKTFLKTTMFPLMENMVDEIEQIDSDVADMIEQSEDVLQPETAGIFAAVITQCMGLITALERRLKKDDVNDQKWAKRLPGIRNICTVAQNTLLEITVTPTGEGDEPDTEGAPAKAPKAVSTAGNDNAEGADAT